MSHPQPDAVLADPAPEPLAAMPEVVDQVALARLYGELSLIHI